MDNDQDHLNVGMGPIYLNISLLCKQEKDNYNSCAKGRYGMQNITINVRLDLLGEKNVE